MKTKNTILAALLFLASIAFAIKAYPSQNADDDKINWEETTIEFNQIKINNPVEGKFYFTNNSDTPVLISRVKSSCGCTVTSYQKDPILPGEKGEIIATYDAKRKGTFRKTITVTLSNSETQLLTIKGNVVE